MLALLVNVDSRGCIELILLTLRNETVGSQVQDAFSYVPISMLQEARSMLAKDPWRMTCNYKPTAFQHCLSDHYFTIRELLDQRVHKLSVMLLDIYNAQNE